MISLPVINWTVAATGSTRNKGGDMKKRIGSKLYDTDTALCILPDRGLYRTQRNQTYFLFDGEKITPVEYDDAAEMIREAGGGDHLLVHRPDVKGNSRVNISAAAADRLAAYCRAHGVTQKKVIEDFIDSLPTE